MVLPSNNELAAMLKGKLNPFERFTDLLSGKDDRQDIMILLLWNIANLLAGQQGQGGSQEFPTGLQVNVPIAVQTVKLMDKVKALTADVIYPDTLADCRKSLRMVLMVENGLDQAVTVEVIGNVSNISNSGTRVIATFNIAAGASGGYGIGDGEWYPYLGVQITPGGVPTKGELNASMVHQVQGEF